MEATPSLRCRAAVNSGPCSVSSVMSERAAAETAKSGDVDMLRTGNVKEEADVPGGPSGEESPRSGQREQESPVMRIKEEAAGEHRSRDVLYPDPSTPQPGGLFMSPPPRSWSSPDSSGENRAHGGTEERASRPGSSRIPGKDHRRYYHSHWRLEYLMDFNARCHSMICMVCGSSLATLKLSTIKRHIRQKHPYSLHWTPSEKEVIIGSWDAHLCVDAQTVAGSAGEDSGADDPNTTPGPKKKRRRLPPFTKGAWRPMFGSETGASQTLPTDTSHLEQYLNESLQQWFKVEFLMDYDCQGNQLHCMMCATVLPSLNLADIKRHILDTHPISLQFSPSQKSSILEAWLNRGKNREEEGEEDMEDDDDDEEEEDLVKEGVDISSIVMKLEKVIEHQNIEGQKFDEAKRLEEENAKLRDVQGLEEETLGTRDVEMLEKDNQLLKEFKRLEEEKKIIMEDLKIEEEKVKALEAKKLEEVKRKAIEAQRLEEENLKSSEAKREEEKQKLMEAQKVEEERQKLIESQRMEEEKNKMEEIRQLEENAEQERRREEEIKREAEIRKAEEKQKELEKQQKMKEIHLALERQQKILEAEKIRKMQLKQIDMKGQPVLSLGVPVIKMETQTPIIITKVSVIPDASLQTPPSTSPASSSASSSETLKSWRVIAPKNASPADPKTVKPATSSSESGRSESGRWPGGVDTMLWEVSLWRGNSLAFTQCNAYQMRWRTDFLMDYNGMRGSVVCMYCCSSLTVLKVSSIKRHIIQKHPHTAQLTTEEKATIIHDWENKVAKLRKAMAEQDKKSGIKPPEGSLKDQFIEDFEHTKEGMEEQSPPPSWTSGAPENKGASWEFAFGRLQGKVRDARNYQHDRWKLEYLMDYTPEKDGLICMVCGVTLLNPKMTTVKMHIQQKHPDTTYLSDQEKAVVMEEWEQKMAPGQKGATQQGGGKETEICIEINEESANTDTNGANAENCGPRTVSIIPSSSKPPATVSLASLPPPCNSGKRNYQVRWRTEFMMDYDCRRHGLICMVCGGTLATLKVSTIKRHIIQVHPYSVEFTTEERQRILAAYSEMALHYIHSEDCFKQQPLMEDMERKRKLAAEEA